MSDTFTFVAPATARRRLEPFTTRLIATALVLAVLVAGFATFVVRAERAADARRATLEAEQAAREQTESERVVSWAQATYDLHQTTPATVPAGVARLLDEQARDAAERALALARGALGLHEDVSAAGMTRLARGDEALLFVDGPSTAPTIVSVAEDGRAWGAAVLGASGTCYWVSVTADGAARYDRGAFCTGRAALAAAHAGW
jgi:hypothetical protein